MSTAALPSNPSLVAILLIARTRRGVKRVFHYPPSPRKERPHVKPDYDDSSGGESSSSSDGDESSIEDEPLGETTKRQIPRSSTIDLDETGSASPEKSAGDLSWTQVEDDGKKTTTVLGFPNGFERLLCPPSVFHKRRFEMNLGGLTFLGCPVFAYENGEWKRPRRPRSHRDSSNMTSSVSDQNSVSRSQEDAEQSTGSADEESTGIETAEHDSGVESDVESGAENIVENSAEDAIENGTENGTEHENKSVEDGAENSVEDGVENEVENETAIEDVPIDDNEPPLLLGDDEGLEDAADKSQPGLSMFHVVFVMNPPPTEYQLRVNEMYKYVVKKFSQALKYEQGRVQYVEKECELLKSLKAKHESASDNAIRNSSLARAIATIYSCIATSRIAHVELSEEVTFSMRIPLPASISHLPDLVSPQLPGLWLTTSTNVASNEDLHLSHFNLASHFALLPLTDLSSIMADITANVSPLSAALANYLQYSSPRKSFQQVAHSSGIPLAEVHFLASHLIYWRRARAVPPLHQRDIYIVSPNADMRRLRYASQQYAKVFSPQLPTLPRMLGLLSAGVRPFATLIPSKDHKSVYFDILAWLLRGGWVTQLRSFGWVRVPAAIQAAVAREEADAAAEAAHIQAEGERPPSAASDRSSSSQGHSSVHSGSASNPNSDMDHLSDAGLPDLGPALLELPLPAALSSGRSTPSSLASARTAIPIGPAVPALLSPATASAVPASPDAPANAPAAPVVQAAPVEAFAPVLILSPTKSSGRESRYLAHISRALEISEGRDVRECWERCLKYLNGEHALEKIAVREGWKRKRVELLRASWVRMGVLLEVRHW